MSGMKRVARGKPETRLDSVDIEYLLDMVASRAWSQVRARIAKMRDADLAELVTQQTEIKTAELRGRIAALNMVLEIPAILVQEGKRTNEKRPEFEASTEEAD